MKTRLKEFITHYSLTAAELADKIGVQRSSISHILNGRNLPSSQFIEKLLNTFPEIDAGWLITGRGSMLKSQENSRPGSSGPPDILPLFKETQAEKQAGKGVSETSLQKKRIEKVLFFFSDRSFTEYYPE